MILISNHLLTLEEFNIKNRLGEENSIFKNDKNIVIRINMAHVKDIEELEKIFKSDRVKHIMLDSEDLFTDIKNDVQLYTYLIERVKKTCKDSGVELLKLSGVVFS